MFDWPLKGAAGLIGLLLLPDDAFSALRASVSQAHSAIWNDAVALLGALLIIVTVTMVGLVLIRLFKRAIRASS